MTPFTHIHTHTERRNPAKQKAHEANCMIPELYLTVVWCYCHCFSPMLALIPSSSQSSSLSFQFSCPFAISECFAGVEIATVNVILGNFFMAMDFPSLATSSIENFGRFIIFLVASIRKCSLQNIQYSLDTKENHNFCVWRRKEAAVWRKPATFWSDLIKKTIEIKFIGIWYVTAGHHKHIHSFTADTKRESSQPRLTIYREFIIARVLLSSHRCELVGATIFLLYAWAHFFSSDFSFFRIFPLSSISTILNIIQNLLFLVSRPFPFALCFFHFRSSLARFSWWFSLYYPDNAVTCMRLV